MFWKRLPINQKLFFAIAVTTILTVCFMTAIVAYGMRAGFAQYLIEVELSRFDPVVEVLSAIHDPENPGWPEIADNQNAWMALALPSMRQHLIEETEREAHTREHLIADLADPGHLSGMDLAHDDPLMLTERLSLHGANDEHLAGAEHELELSGRRPIEALNAQGETIIAGWLVLAAPTDRPWITDSIFITDDLFMNRQLWGVVLSALLAVFLSGIAAFIVARQFTLPVNTLMENTQKLASGEYSLRMSNDYQDEFGALVDDFNALAQNLELTKRKEKQWISNAAHELRTPVAMLQAELEAVIDGVHPADEKRLNLLHNSTLRLAQLVGDLNIITSEQEGKLLLNSKVACISRIITDRIDEMRDQIAAQGFTFTDEIEPHLYMECDAVRIGQLVDNLVENSRRYTDIPGTISVSLKKLPSNHYQFVVEDSVPAPSRESMQLLFERFFRAEESRARHLGGSGLGLPICRAIVISHGGEITAKLSVLGGLRMECLFLGEGITHE